jgi:hypothetical protein
MSSTYQTLLWWKRFGGWRAAETLTLQPDSTTGLDTELRGSTATTNYSTAASIGIGEFNGGTSVRRGLIKFDLSSIPAKSRIVTATLTLTMANPNDFSDNARTLSAYRQLRAWVLAQTTWNIYKTGSNWGTAGGFGAADCEQTDIGNVAIGASEAVSSTHAIVLTPAKVQEWVSGALTNNGLLLKVDTETDDLYNYHSSDSLTAGARPKLVVVYQRKK